jgi:hypothetical protein
MASFDEFRKNLEKTDSKEHDLLFKHVTGLVKISRGDMCKNFSTWDEHDLVFRSRRRPDKEDRQAAAEGKPIKMIVPLTFSQIMTFVAFSVMSITQNRRFFELEPTGTEDNPLEEPIELIVERDLRRNQWNAFLVQFFLDIGRFSLAAAEVCYSEETRWMRVEEEKPVDGGFGTERTETTNNFQEIPVFVGNRIYPVSPYRFLPDTRMPLSRYQQGEFCGSEDVFSLESLRGQENTMNLDKIPKFTEGGYANRRKISRVDLGPWETRENPNLGATSGDSFHDSSNFVTSGPVTVTKMVFDMRPCDLKDGETKVLGDEEHYVRYICWIGNDKTIIRFEEAYYLHGMFPYICGQYLADQHHLVNDGLAEICEQITNLVTWKLNAHVASIRSSIDGKIAVDPAGVDMRSLESRSPYILLKKNAGLTGVDRYLKQFQTVDTTMNVMKDVGDLDNLLEKITGWSGQMQGQYSQGRRSATQDRVVAQGASARGKTTLGGIWDTAFEPLGRQLITNNRQEMDKETFLRIMGKRTWPTNPGSQAVPNPATDVPEEVPFTDDEIFSLFKSDPVSLAMAEDFFVFDGTLPSEKAFLAQSLQEILSQIMANPQVASVLGFDSAAIRELFNQIYLLRGVTPARLPAPSKADMAQAAAALGQQQGGQQGPKPPNELISVKLADLVGSEREQALAMFGIKADQPAHEKLLKMQNPPPNSGGA